MLALHNNTEVASDRDGVVPLVSSYSLPLFLFSTILIRHFLKRLTLRLCFTLSEIDDVFEKLLHLCMCGDSVSFKLPELYFFTAIMVGKDWSLFQSTLHIFHDIIYETRKTINLHKIENLGIYYHELKDVSKRDCKFSSYFQI